MHSSFLASSTFSKPCMVEIQGGVSRARFNQQQEEPTRDDTRSGNVGVCLQGDSSCMEFDRTGQSKLSGLRFSRHAILYSSVYPASVWHFCFSFSIVHLRRIRCFFTWAFPGHANWHADGRRDDLQALVPTPDQGAHGRWLKGLNGETGQRTHTPRELFNHGASRTSNQ